MSEATPAARSALWVALGLLAVAWPGASPPSPRCADPGSAEPGRAGWTRAVACEPGSSRARVTGPARRLFGLGLDPNRVDAGTLETLPGIGPARARALVAARAENRFCRPRDLERAEGIGPRIRQRIAPELRFPERCEGPPSPLPSGPESW